LYLNVDYKAIVIKIRHAVLKIFEQLYKIFEQFFQILATFEQLFGIFLSNFLPFSEQNLDAPSSEGHLDCVAAVSFPFQAEIEQGGEKAGERLG